MTGDSLLYKMCNIANTCPTLLSHCDQLVRRLMQLPLNSAAPGIDEVRQYCHQRLLNFRFPTGDTYKRVALTS